MLKNVSFNKVIISSIVLIILLFSVLAITSYKSLIHTQQQLNQVVYELTPIDTTLSKSILLLTNSHDSFQLFLNQNIVTAEELLENIKFLHQVIVDIDQHLELLTTKQLSEAQLRLKELPGISKKVLIMLYFYIEELEQSGDINADSLKSIFPRIKKHLFQLDHNLRKLTSLDDVDLLSRQVEKNWRTASERLNEMNHSVERYQSQHVTKLETTLLYTEQMLKVLRAYQLQHHQENFSEKISKNTSENTKSSTNLKESENLFVATTEQKQIINSVLSKVTKYRSLIYNYKYEQDNNYLNSDTSDELEQAILAQWKVLDVESRTSHQLTKKKIKQSLIGVTELAEKELHYLLIMSSTLLIIVLSIAWLFTRIITSRLNTLLIGAEAIKSGDYKLTIDLHSHDEFAQLANVYNQMAKHIDEQQSELQNSLQLVTNANQKVQASNLLLEDKVLERTQRFKEAKLEAEQANRTKSDFLASMSHEIRTPMNAIMGLTKLLLKKNLDIGLKSQLGKIQRSSNSLLHIINDILDFSKIEAGKMELEHIPYQLNEILHHLGELFREPCQANGNELNLWMTPDCPNAIIGDPVRMEQILMNLIGNANKFTHNGEIEVQVSFQALDENKLFEPIAHLTFKVKDSGIGIEKNRIKDLFNPFSQADGSITRKYGGTGLGLSISTKLVEKMGGNLEAKSEVNKGSEFYFSLEVERQDEVQLRHLSLPSELKNKKILVIDDNETAIIIIRHILESLDLVVDTVESGLLALQQLHQLLAIDSEVDEIYELIVLDWLMPEMDGIETAQQIIDIYHKAGRKTPYFLMQTSSPDEIEIVDFVEQNEYFYLLSKPIKQHALYEHIKQAFGFKSEQGEFVKSHKTSFDKYKKQLKGVRVLLVEDNLINQEVAKDVLLAMEMQVTIANNGQIALDQIEQHFGRKQPFELVLMDLQMPVMDGLSATTKLRLDSRYNHLPIIALTAHAQTQQKEECIETGMNDFISKPFDDENLYKILVEQLILSQPIRILLVEDEPINQEVIKHSLDELRLEHDIFGTIKEGLIAYKNNAYDLVLMDLNLPDGNGFEATENIRDYEKEHQQKVIPIIALTASLADEDKQESLHRGMNDFMTKPFETEQFKQLILKWINDQSLKEDFSGDNVAADKKGISAFEKGLATNENKVKDKNDAIVNNVLDSKTLAQIQKRPSLFKKLVSIYVRTYTLKVDELINAVENSHYELIKEIAHPFKSSSKQLGAMQLADKLALIEQQGRDEKLSSDSKELMQQTKDEFEVVVTTLKGL